MAIKLDYDIMVTNMCVKFGEDWTNSFQELDRKQFSGCTYIRICGGITNEIIIAYIHSVFSLLGI